MTGRPARPAVARRDVVVVGAATRDVDHADPRGWRLGGGVAYGALTLARLGLPTTALVGADRAASEAWELDLLRAAGARVRVVPLDRGPVFENRETPTGRIQLSHGTAAPMPPAATSADLGQARAWLFAPVAGEVPAGWAAVPSNEALVALGWQGLLRRLEPGATVQRVSPAASLLLRRANLVGLSHHDVDASVEVAELLALLRPGATLVITEASGGGLVVEAESGGTQRPRRYAAVPPARIVDPTGAGDAFLAALLAARLEPELIDGPPDQGGDLLLAAVVASFVVEGVGIAAVPSRSAVRERMQERRGSH